MPKAFYRYVTDDGTEEYSFLQDTAEAAVVGNVGATVGTPRLPHKFKPRRLSLRNGPPFTYKHVIMGSREYAGFSIGTVTALGTVVGQDGEVNNGQAAY